MCGIAGILNLQGRLSPGQMREAAERMARRMSHRGPDDQGIWLSPDNRCVLVHRRLSIIDTSPASHQPMARGTRHWLTYNGELYNFQDLRDEMQTQGEAFATRGDTEVFLAGLVRQGPWFLTRVDAMFALALYDAAAGELLLARDAFGEKPLYHTTQNGVFAFASELSALTMLPDFDAGISVDAIATYLTLQLMPAPATIYRSCRKLPAGSYMRVGSNGPADPVRYYEFIVDGQRAATASLDEQADELEELLLCSLRRRLISDVPLGAFLSGGVDSSTAVALVTKRLGRPLQTFSIGYEGTPDSEHLHAQQIADHLGVEHHTRLLTTDLVALGGELAARMDEPTVDSSCVPTFLVSQWARQSVTVALTGDGGDELFGGYNRYFDCLEATRGREADVAARRWHIGRDYYSGRMLVWHDTEMPPLFGGVPAGTADLILSLRRRVDLDPRPVVHRLREMDARYYLPVVLAKVDRMSMLNSLECRTPYLSVDVARFAAGLPESQVHDGRNGKLVLKQLASRYLPREWLERPKMGFGLPVAGDWTKRHVLPQLARLLTSEECRLAGWLGRRRLAHFMERYAPSYNLYQLWGLMVLEIWLRHNPALLDGEAVPDLGEI